MNTLLRWFFVLSLTVSLTRAAERPLRVVTLHTVLTEIATQVGGDHVSVNGLLKPGIDPHSFDPSAADIRALVEADIALASGLELESYLDRLASNTGGKARVIKVGDALPNLLLAPAEAGGGSDHGHAHESGERDPHWWNSVNNVIAATEIVRAACARLRPEWSADFTRNALAYTARLVALKTWAETEVARIPAGRRQLVTTHDAFAYLARDYGFKVQAVGGLSTDSEPDARHVAALVDLIRREKIPAIFAEASANSRVIQNLVRETGVKLGDVLYADGLGPVGGDAATYEAMYRHNITAITGPLK